MKRLEKRVMLLSVIALLAITIVGFALADPVATGTLTPTSSSRGTDAGSGQLDAQGGNVTNVDIASTSITSKWAGFYGDITGVVSLENGGGAVFYNWTSASPTGQVYATRDSSPTWGSIACASEANAGTEGDELNLNSGLDNITNTFCETCGNHSAFSVGVTSFTADECSLRTNAYDNNGNQTTNWDQVLLYEGSNVVYSTIINQDTTGFDGSTYDFQLLVGENSSTSVLTTYYFYVEI